MRITINDWGYENCLMANAPTGSWFMPWGYSIVENDSTVTVYRHICGEIVRETDKAVQIEYKTQRFNSRCDLYGNVLSWRTWIPKKCIINDRALYFDGGQSTYVDKCVFDALKEGKEVTKTWAYSR